MKSERSALALGMVSGVIFLLSGANASLRAEEAIQPSEPESVKTSPVPVRAPAVHGGEKSQASAPGTASISGSDGEVARLKAIIRKQESEIDMLLSRNETLSRQMQEIISANTKERALLCYNMGCVYKATKEFAKAEMKFTEAHRLNPADLDVIYNLAILYDDNLKDKAKARMFYEKFIAMSTDEQDVARVKEWLKSLTAVDPEVKK